MVTYDCNCKDIAITEGIFGEIYAGVLLFHLERAQLVFVMFLSVNNDAKAVLNCRICEG